MSEYSLILRSSQTCPETPAMTFPHCAGAEVHRWSSRVALLGEALGVMGSEDNSSGIFRKHHKGSDISSTKDIASIMETWATPMPDGSVSGTSLLTSRDVPSKAPLAEQILWGSSRAPKSLVMAHAGLEELGCLHMAPQLGCLSLTAMRRGGISHHLFFISVSLQPPPSRQMLQSFPSERWSPSASGLFRWSDVHLVADKVAQCPGKRLGRKKLGMSGGERAEEEESE